MIDDNSALKCAHCGDTNLHHDEVTVFERREDASEGLRVKVVCVDRQHDDAPLPRLTVDTSMRGNPSARRQGVLIGLWCESCGKRSSLTISQHKGATYLACGRSS